MVSRKNRTKKKTLKQVGVIAKEVGYLKSDELNVGKG